MDIFSGLLSRVVSKVMPFLLAVFPLIQVLFVGVLSGISFRGLWEATGRIVTCWLLSWGCVVMRLILGAVVPYLQPYFESLGQLGTLDLSPIIQWWLLGDYYLPVSEFVTGLSTAAAFIASIRIFRFVKQFVPSIAN